MAKKTAMTTTGKTAIARYDEELAAEAEAYAAQEASTGGGQFFSIRGGTLSLGGAPIPGNEMIVVVADSILVNAHYAGDYDPDAPASPTCYAFGRDENTIAAHEDSEEPVHDGPCVDCPNNQWGSAEKGRGKACKNGRRLALISAGDLNSKTGEFTPFDADELAKAAVAYLNLPPTSLNSFGAYVKQLAGTLRRPPHAVYTRVSVVPDPKTQLKVIFECVEPVPAELIPTVRARNKEVKSIIEFPFTKGADREQTKQAKAGRSSKSATRPAKRRF